jgi:nitroreductase
VVDQRDRLGAIADDIVAAPRAEAYTPHDPSTGQARPDWSSTVNESADVLRAAPAAIFIENRGPFSGGRQALLRAEPQAQALAIVGYELELAGLGAALQTMWLAALGFGLSAVFMGDIAVAEAAIGARLRMDGDLIGALALGYSSQAAPEPAAPEPDLVRWDTDGT